MSFIKLGRSTSRFFIIGTAVLICILGFGSFQINQVRAQSGDTETPIPSEATAEPSSTPDTPTDVATVTPAATDTLAATDTRSPIGQASETPPKPTSTPDTPTDVATEIPAPTDTLAATDTRPPTDQASETPTATNTPVTPTATPVTPTATPIIPTLTKALIPPPIGPVSVPTQLIVNSTGDVDHGSCASVCSLRDAMIAANAVPDTNTIQFNLPGSGPYVITLTSDLPVTTYPVIIDGTTQPGFVSTPIVQLNCTNNCLVLIGGKSTARGIVFRTYTTAVTLGTTTSMDSGNNVIEGNFFGTDVTGMTGTTTSTLASRTAIIVYSDNNRIGGTTAGARNLISCNGTGLKITGSRAFSNRVVGNYFGTDITGTHIGTDDPNWLVNQSAIALMAGASNNVIGGTTAGERNLISGNGIGIGTSGATNTVIEGNYIGTDVTGSAQLANTYGVLDMGTNTMIGGTTAGAGNVISGNAFGIMLGYYDVAPVPASQNTVVQGNFIGPNAAGTGAVPPYPVGGAWIQDGAIQIVDAAGPTIGGSDPAERNVISGNYASGISISHTHSDFLIQGNYIGVSVDGVSPLGNGFDGIRITDNASLTSSNNQIVGNKIAFNAERGIEMSGGTFRLQSNQLYSNGALGIDLSPSYGVYGVTPNDTGDSDAGGNNLQNFPVIDGVLAQSGSLIIQGTLNSMPNSSYTLEFFDNSTCDPSGNGEGQSPLDTATVTTDSGGSTRFSLTFSAVLNSADVLTATATSSGATSEFSPCFGVAQPPRPPAMGFPMNFVRNRVPIPFSWTPVTIADQYHISIDTTSGSNILDQTLSAASVCSNNTCQTSVSLPNGDYTWKVQSLNINGAGSWSSPASFSLGDPPGQLQLTAPSGTITAQPSAYQWNTAAGAANYQLILSQVVNGHSSQIYTHTYAGNQVCAGNQCSATTILLANGDYTWNIIASNNYGSTFGSLLSFTISGPVPDVSVMIAPQGTITTPNPTYQWYAASEATSYELIINQVFDGGSNVVYDNNFDDTQVCVGNLCSATAYTLFNGNYTWNLVAINDYGTTDSGSLIFTVAVPLPSVPVAIAPLGIITTSVPTYQWQSDPVADSYLVKLYQMVNGSPQLRASKTVQSSACSSTCSTALSSLPANGDYQWTITANNTAGSVSNDPAAFTLAVPPPDAPVPIAPQGPVTTTQIIFQWTSVTGADSYDLEVIDANGHVVNLSPYPPGFPPLPLPISCVSGICSIDETLPNGNYTWHVRAYNSYGGYGPWSDVISFAVSVLPVAVQITGPTNYVGDGTTNFTWNSVFNVSAYHLAVHNGDGVVFEQDFDTSICTVTTCVANPLLSLPDGAYTWTVQTKNSTGSGPISNSLDFIVGPVVVNSTDDVNDGVCNLVHCSLREAILLTNTLHGINRIYFKLSSAPYRIQPTTPLPTITNPVILDATSQPGFAGTPLVELRGSSSIQFGLRISAGSSTVRGFVINGFSDSGIYLESGASNTVAGNFIGTDSSGIVKWSGNGQYGISMDPTTTSNMIGGPNPEDRNVVSGYSSSSSLSGIEISSGNIVEGNYSGTDKTGLAVINNQTGVNVYGSNNIIRNNLLSGNYYGVYINSSGSGNRIQGNLIGTDATGNQSLPYYTYGTGIYLYSASNNLIGGSAQGQGNVIVAGSDDVVILSGNNNTVQGNFIGVNGSRAVPIGSVGNGIYVFGGSGNTIGGTVSGAGNIIGANSLAGISLLTASNTVIQGNWIGTDPSGIIQLGNGSHGIQVTASSAIIGGQQPGTGNTIAFNGGAGISSASTGVSIHGNQIFGNALLGIDIPPQGVTANDPGDTDLGLQNFPILSLATSSGEITVVAGTLDSRANTIFDIELFSNSACDPSSYGEGEHYIGSTTALTDSSGNAEIFVKLPLAVSPGSLITATATDPDGNTSEFSHCFAVSGPGALPSTPANLRSTSQLATSIRLAWDDSDSETEYYVERSFDGLNGWVSAGTPHANITTLIDNNVLCGTQYYYRIQAHNLGGDSAFSSLLAVSTMACLPGPLLRIPSDGAAIYTHALKLIWKAVKNSVSYHITLDNVTDPDHVVNVADTDVTTPYYQTGVLPLGSYRWKVRAQDAKGWSADSLPFSFDVTLLKAPKKNGATLSHLPKFAWVAAKGAPGYHLQLFSSESECAAGSSVTFETDAPKPTYTMKLPDPALNLGSYYWRVMADGGSYTPCWRFDVTTLQSPKNGATATNFLPKFSWAANRLAAGYQITVTGVPDDGSSGPSFTRQTTRPAYPSVTSDGFGYGHYRWSIQEDLGSGFGPNTPYFDLYITIMTKPANNIFTVDTTPSFSWKSIKGETYTLEISTDPGFGPGTIVRSYTGLTKTSYTIPDADALPQGQYYWRVKATVSGYIMPGWLLTVGP